MNPDAERELSASGSYAPRKKALARILERRALFELLTQGESGVFAHELERQAPASEHQGKRALIWCPTPSALTAVQKAGLKAQNSPSVENIRRVSDKRFLSERLPSLTLPQRRIIRNREEWNSYHSSFPGPLRLKRPFGYAGKGQRIWSDQGRQDDLRWLNDSLVQGGFVAEANIREAQEFSLHGMVDMDGTLLGQPCLLETDKHGAPERIQPAASTLSPSDKRELLQMGNLVGVAISEEGYFGPFGMDFLQVNGTFYLIDLNARFSLGWSIGMGEKRADAIERILQA